MIEVKRVWEKCGDLFTSPGPGRTVAGWGLVTSKGDIVSVYQSGLKTKAIQASMGWFETAKVLPPEYGVTVVALWVGGVLDFATLEENENGLIKWNTLNHGPIYDKDRWPAWWTPLPERRKNEGE